MMKPGDDDVELLQDELSKIDKDDAIFSGRHDDVPPLVHLLRSSFLRQDSFSFYLFVHLRARA